MDANRITERIGRDIPPTRRIDEPPSQDGAPLAGWPTTITSEQAAALQTALKQLQTALDAVTRERDEARAEVRRAHDAASGGDELLRAAFTRLLDRLTRERDEARAEVERMREAHVRALKLIAAIWGQTG